MFKENDSYQSCCSGEMSHYQIQKCAHSLEQLKAHLTHAAEISEEVGLFLKTAEIKKVTSDICRMQGKDDDAAKLECSISELRKKSKSTVL